MAYRQVVSNRPIRSAATGFRSVCPGINVGVSELSIVLLLTLLPAGGNFAGGVAAELLPGSERVRSLALHAAAGVVIAVVAVEIMPEAVGAVPGWAIAAAFLAGGLLYMLVEWLIERTVSAEGTGRMWMIYVAVATDLFSDGLMIGAGTSLGVELGLSLAIGQVLADIPEGAAAIMTFRNNKVPRAKRLALSASFLIPVVLGALLSFFLLRGRSEAVQLSGLVVTAGLFSVAAFEDMVREAHETGEDSQFLTLSLILGFALFALISTGLN